MKGMQPFMLLRCLPQPEAREDFERWFHEVHLNDVRQIPGIEAVYASTAADGARLGIYVFESPQAVQAALQSPQAAYARGTWNNWASRVDELHIEIFAPLLPMPAYQSIN